MKKGLNVLRLMLSALIALLALVFVIIEGRNLFSGDWLIYEYAVNGGIRYLCRLLLALFVLAQGVLPFVNLKKKSEQLTSIIIGGSAGLVVMSVFLLFFATNYVGEAALGISVVYLVFVLLSGMAER